MVGKVCLTFETLAGDNLLDDLQASGFRTFLGAGTLKDEIMKSFKSRASTF